ncbi:MAG: RNA polymerase sigma-70 factor [Cyclobacteriaceae bacterium]
MPTEPVGVGRVSPFSTDCHFIVQAEDFKPFFDAHYPELVRKAYIILKDANAAEDIVQDVFLKVWQKRHDLKITQSMRSYLMRSVINSSLNYLDKHKRISTPEFLPEQSQSETDNQVAFSELNVKLSSALEKLSPQRQTIFSLSLYEGMSNQEIADEMGLAKKTVDNQLGTALKQLREHLSDYIQLLIDLTMPAAAILVFFLITLG